MNLKAVLILILFIPACFISSVLTAQMPDWKYFRDREGNGYYYDRAFKIRITDEKPFNYTPASSAGIDYYLNKGIELIKDGKYSQGLFYLKSLKTLSMDNLRVRNSAKTAAEWINYLQKKHGIRYEGYDRESTVLLSLSEGKYSLINEKLRYKIILNRQPHITRASWKLNDAGYGLKFGFNLDDGNSDEGYDCIVGIETRILRGKINSLNDAEDSWRNEFGKDNFKREEVLRGDDRVVYLYSYSDGVPFSGIEGVFINGKIIHIIRVLCGSGIKERVFDVIRKPVEEMILVK